MYSMHGNFLNRREFNRLGAALGLSLPVVGASISGLSSARNAAAALVLNDTRRTVKFHDGTVVPALGQGSWHLGQGRHPQTVEEEALRTGISLGMTLIDTSEGYGGDRSEELIGRAIAGQRERVFLVSKVNVSTKDGILRACEGSLTRLGTDYLDLYLLHWRTADTDLSVVVAAFENLRAAGKIRLWGVSNFNTSDMEDLFRVRDGDRCATNQVLYNLNSREIENDLLPWCKQHGMPVMAYSPLGGDITLVHHPTLTMIGAAHNCSASAVALAWAIRSGDVIAIPESGSPAHVKENAVALTLMLSPHDIQTLDAAFRPRFTDPLRSLLGRIKRWLHRFRSDG
jgi:diketogulonate reductase-like aldo/keto reductase